MLLRPTTFSRRQVLTASAWAAPTILIAAGVPAAVVPVGLNIAFANFSTFYDWTEVGHRVAVSGDTMVKVTGKGLGKVTSLTVVLTIAAAGLNPTVAPTVIAASDARWSRTPSVAVGLAGTLVYTFTWADAAGQSVGGDTGVLQFRLPGVGNELDAALPKTFTAVATSTNAGIASAAGTVGGAWAAT